MASSMHSLREKKGSIGGEERRRKEG